MDPYSRAMIKYFDFDTRASRSEFWLFNVMLFMLTLVVYWIQHTLGTARPDGGGLLVDLFMLVNAIPQVTVGIRRMHDTDHTGWWLLLPPAAFVLACRGSMPTANRFGPVPTPPRYWPRRAGTKPSAAPDPVPAQPHDIVADLERLSQLRADGTLTAAEFEVMKARALGHGKTA